MESTTNNEDYFLGVLYSSKYKNLSIENQKKMLIENKVYIIEENEYFSSLTSKNKAENEIELGQSFFYLKKTYKINDLFLKELYEYIRDDVYSSLKMPLDIKIKEINLHAKHLVNYNDVNEFYKEQYKEHYYKIKENTHFFIYNEPGAWEYPDWEYFVTEEISHNSLLIETHLFSEFGYSSFEEISLSWQDLHYYTEIMNFLTEKISGSVDESLSKLIFKDNGEEIFNHLVLSYQENKKQAFYSYLYYFLMDDLKKIKLQDEDSNTYKAYVIKKGYLKEYGRMQRARATNKKTHNKMVKLFQEMYSEKFEKIMSKDE